MKLLYACLSNYLAQILTFTKVKNSVSIKLGRMMITISNRLVVRTEPSNYVIGYFIVRSIIRIVRN
jgi:hypothetical protein